jgi:hypothetical protein
VRFGCAVLNAHLTVLNAHLTVLNAHLTVLNAHTIEHWNRTLKMYAALHAVRCAAWRRKQRIFLGI